MPPTCTWCSPCATTFSTSATAHAELAPIFRDLTPLGTAGRQGPAARPDRARGQAPAIGSRTVFSSDEMVDEVAEERGALPLLAFAVARLWEQRDQERRLLTREAYQGIGGVSGALAQHAEETLNAIGEEWLPIVREIFRNLVTAQGTRATRTTDELVSVFDEDQQAAARRDSGCADRRPSADLLRGGECPRARQ